MVADTAGRWPQNREVTSDFVYIRLHGAEELYASGYTGEALDAWAAQIGSWLDDGLDAYVYFDDDMKVRAPYDAVGLSERLGIRTLALEGRAPSVDSFSASRGRRTPCARLLPSTPQKARG